jgi:DNA-binding LacI/PurR family transcriptional regulator
MFADPALPRLLGGIEEAITPHGIQMVLFAPGGADDIRRLEAYLSGHHVDAVILLTSPELDGLSAVLQSIGTPVVYGGKPRGQREASFVDVDNQGGGRTATEHLITQGRRRIAHIAGPEDVTATSDRLQGFREAMWNAALRSDLIEHGNLDRDSGEMAMSRLLNRAADIDAVFAASDAMAAGAMWAMQILGRRVPDDVAIIGFDDSTLAASTQPPLSSVRRPFEDMGRKMARLILEYAEVGAPTPAQQLVLDPELVLRESTRGSSEGRTRPRAGVNIPLFVGAAMGRVGKHTVEDRRVADRRNGVDRRIAERRAVSHPVSVERRAVDRRFMTRRGPERRRAVRRQDFGLVW